MSAVEALKAARGIRFGVDGDELVQQAAHRALIVRGGES